MDWTILAYSGAMTISAITAAFLGRYALSRKTVPGAMPLAAMCLGVTIWTFNSGLYVHVASPKWREWIVACQFAGIVILPPAWLSFTLRFTGHHSRLTRFPTAIGTILGVIMVLMVATNHRFKWIWHEVSILGQLQSRPTGFYWMFVCYAYLLIFTGIVVIAARMFTMSAIHRRQGAHILLAGLFPVFIDLLTLTGIVPEGPIDLMPIGFLASVLLLWTALFRYKMLDLTLVDHELLLQSISDGIIAMDNLGRIVEINGPARKMLPDLHDNIVGKPAAEALSFWSQVRPESNQACSRQIEMRQQSSGKELFFEARLMPLLGWQKTPGYLLILRDITDRRRAEAEREILIGQLQDALGQVKRLSGLLPICSKCKKIRDEAGSWQYLETYLHQHSEAKLTHGLCPDCVKTLYPDFSG